MTIFSFGRHTARSVKVVTTTTLFFTLYLTMLATSVFSANPKVEIKTNLGAIQIELYADQAPKTVENFLSYVNDDYYTGTIFHRVIAKFMIQGGGFDQNYTQKPTRQPVENEATNGLKNTLGTIAMARTNEPHSASSQFFINVANNDFLDYTAPTMQGYGYTVFGKVTAGMDVVNAIAGTPTGANGPFNRDVPQNMIVIESIKLLPASANSENP
ncbi:peptidyl-prolyl cis-trans isomerase A (cyclophilin A)/peptidyl-prolyl cis-trans isomerase B (cyclophilin B) [Nitrosomonas eutropha]|uniref:Peptidyl-prolyl cis-trans isomerase n=1 Tax=Nitrosomonas eutropha TaxID=916 RepID=A0A1I7I7I7_9PROT|nr:peptidylprolyl isomerase [Nitrosomonas eutropha]SFU68933.1 peptidyl-prolyl cis-trans isomerase A (cyclophilin A)/peptidyl-prolyl cis-trans isomerase B (cyclophilin B) [Nitrosomonas eutropha]